MVAEDSAQLIPTESRARLPRGQSYPLNASQLSEGLRDTRQFGRLVVSFYAHPQSISREGSNLYFAGVTCRSRDLWSVWVSAVPSDSAAVARRFALEHGLPFVRAWLAVERGDTWFLHGHQCTLAIDPITNEGILAELEEQRLVRELPPIPLHGHAPPPGGRPKR